MNVFRLFLPIFTLFLATGAPRAHGMVLLKSIATGMKSTANLAYSAPKAGLFQRTMGTRPQSFKNLIDESIARVNEEKHSPTELTLACGQSYARKMLERDPDGEYRYFPEDSVVKVTKKIIELERPLQDTHYTFVHGRQWGYHVVEKVYRYLQQLWSDGAPLENFRYLNTSGVTSGTDEVYMNPTLFDNSIVPSSNALCYFLDNFNQNTIRDSTKQVVIRACDEKLYEKYATALKDMEQKGNKLTRCGEIMLLGFPKDTVQEYVIHRGIARRDLQPPVKIDIKGTVTQDTKKIIEARRIEPFVGFGEINFVAPMMKVGRDKKVTIVSANDIDPEKYQEWQEQSFKPVMNEIANEMMPEIRRQKAAFNINRLKKAARKGITNAEDDEDDL